MSRAVQGSAGAPSETAFIRPHRIYLGSVAILALWVGIWSYIVPAESARGIPWSLPPLCATFLGSMYFSGATFTAVSMLPRRWANARVVLPMIAIWTGGLTIVSLFYLPAFDFSRPQVWVWFGAYIVYPLIALRLVWVLRHERHVHPEGPAIPSWAKLYLAAQGAIMVGLAVVLLFAADAIQPLWPWRTGEMMLQMYSMPLFSYGLGSFILLRQRAWSEIRIGLVAMGLFTGFELAASLRFGALLNGPPAAVVLWLAWLALTTAALFTLAWIAYRQARPIGQAQSVGLSSWQPAGEAR
jgi:hypothetical protein